MKKFLAIMIAAVLFAGMDLTVYAQEKESEFTEIAVETSSFTTKKIETIMYTNDEIKLLACTIQAEAGNQSYKGKVAVGNVILNRVKSNRYPNTIKDVIYAKSQFSVVRNGSLNRMLRNYNTTAQSKECIVAAKAALDGENYVGSRTGFRRYTKSFASRVSNYLVIGDHIFH